MLFLTKAYPCAASRQALFALESFFFLFSSVLILLVNHIFIQAAVPPAFAVRIHQVGIGNGRRDNLPVGLSGSPLLLPGKQERGTRQADREIITATVSDSYLMDSYSKSGRYCRLNENMIYQKNQDGREEEEEAF